jgi:HAE1 family hydrophobic/amphiphilic exporter-1
VCALTLSPALCALLLKAHTHGDGHAAGRGFILFRPFKMLGRLFNRAFELLTRGYAAIVRLSCRLAIVTLLLFAGVMAVTVNLYSRVPAGFVPNEDLGFVVVAAQLPDGASLQRSKAVIDRVSDLVGEVDGVRNVVSLAGFSVLVGNGTSYANAWVVLDPWDERARTGRTVDTIIADINARVQSIQEATFLVFGLPPINGLGNTSGVELKVLDQQALGRAPLQQAVEDIVATVSSQSQMAYAYTNYRAGVPQIYLDVDREKVKKLNIRLDDVFGTLQAFLGSAYVNDFNQFNRTYQVNIQADARFRLQPEDIRRLEVRNLNGEMVPLGTFIRIRDAIGPERVERFQMYPAATVNGIPRPGTSSGDAIGIMEQIAADKLPLGMGSQWTTMAFQEKIAAQGAKITIGGREFSISSAILSFGMALLLVYLILAAQYENLLTPLAVLISVPLVIIGAVGALLYRGLDNNVFTQIGLVLLVGLGAKNAILIVEFARENRARGVGIIDSAVEAARTRFRPIIMTSLAFILGVVPLLGATGAGAASRRAIGTAVFGGMVGNTVLGLLFTPVLYVVVQAIDEWIRRRVGAEPVATHPADPSADGQAAPAIASAG